MKNNNKTFVNALIVFVIGILIVMAVVFGNKYDDNTITPSETEEPVNELRFELIESNIVGNTSECIYRDRESGVLYIVYSTVGISGSQWATVLYGPDGLPLIG